MARLLGLFAVMFIGASLSSPMSPPLAVADWGEVQATVGGACEDCETDNRGPCVGTTCTANGNGTFTKKVGTLASPIYCIVARPVGVDKCTASNPKPCTNTYTCTDAACTNCGAATPANVTTKCALSGTLCRVGS